MSTKNTLKNAEQPGATGCSASPTLETICQEYTPSAEICQALSLDSSTAQRLAKAGLVTIGDVAQILAAEGEAGLMALNGIGARTVQALQQALRQGRENTPPPAGLSLDDIERQLDEVARDRALSLLSALEEAREDLRHLKASTAETVAAATAAADEAREALEAVDQKAEAQMERAFNLLGTGPEGRLIVEQIIAARDTALLDAESRLESAKDRLAQAEDSRQSVLTEGREMVALLEQDLEELVTKSPVAAATAREGRQVLALAAQADGFTEQNQGSASGLERLMEQLSGYAQRYPAAASALVSLEHYAETWYAEGLREEIEALVPSRSFPEELEAIVKRAQDAGVAGLIEDAVETARARDRQALAEKSRKARLYAKELANSSRAQSGDVVAHRAGRVTVYRRDNGHYRITQAYVIDQGANNQAWVWKKDQSLVGRTVRSIQTERTYQA